MSHQEHRQKAVARLRLRVLTLSDTRTEAEDTSGNILRELLKEAGHEIDRYQLIREDPDLLRETFDSLLQGDPDAIITNGGTGLTHRDGTIEVARTLFTKELPGFGELFRFLSFQQIGTAAILSRATAGVVGNTLLVCLPGSSKAVRLAAKRILIPELPHMVWEIRRQSENPAHGAGLQLL